MDLTAVRVGSSLGDNVADNSVTVGEDMEAKVGQGRSVQAESPARIGSSEQVEHFKRIFDAVITTGHYNFAGARIQVPSALNIKAWRAGLSGYRDAAIVEYLEFGWPINFDRSAPLRSTLDNHASAVANPGDIEHYIEVELGHGALVGPFNGPPVAPTQLSPLMTRPKKDSVFKRVIMDLSWPPGGSVNDGIDSDMYIDGPVSIRLPTVDYMEQRVCELGAGSYMYKTDLARGYRQLRVDPSDWPLLGFGHGGKVYMDVCPPFGLKTSAMCMQRTSEAICYLHGRRGFYSKAYLDDFGGAEREEEKANEALDVLQEVLASLGVKEALHKVCRPARIMIWLGIIFNTIDICPWQYHHES